MLLTALTLAYTAQAQDLSTEVVVDRTVTPEENIATRPGGLTPTLVLPAATPSALMPQIYSNLSAITRSFAPLAPFGGSHAIEATPYRGYLSASYGPTLNTDIRAGYRFIQSETLSVGGFASFESESYRSFQPRDWRLNRYFGGRVAAYATWRPDSLSTLDASLSGRFLTQETDSWDALPAQIGRLSVSWTSRTSQIAYGASADVTIDHYKCDSYYYDLTDYDIDAYAAYILNPGVQLGMDINARGLADTEVNNYAVTFAPYLSYKGKGISTRIGLGLEPAGGDGATGFHIVPQFDFNAAITPAVGFYARINGGIKQFTLEMMRQYTVFIDPILMDCPENSYAKIVAEGGFVFGPFAGLSLEVFGGYANTRDWLILSNIGFDFADVKGWHAGGELCYTSELIKAHIKGDFAPRDDKKYITDRNYWAGNVDLADMKVDFAFDVNPIPALTAGISYEFVHGRDQCYNAWDPGLARFQGEYKIISNLGLHAQYNVTEALSLHGKLDNILNRHYAITPMVPAQGFNGMVGVTYKF